MGYIQQAFRRVCVRESLQHGEANKPYVQRDDVRRTAHGRVIASRKVENESPVPPMPSVHEAAEALRSEGAAPA